MGGCVIHTGYVSRVQALKSCLQGEVLSGPWYSSSVSLCSSVSTTGNGPDARLPFQASEWPGSLLVSLRFSPSLYLCVMLNPLGRTVKRLDLLFDIKGRWGGREDQA